MQQNTRELCSDKHKPDQAFDTYAMGITLPSDPLFSTGIDLWPLYIESFHDLTERQYHNCNACRHFISRYGNLVTIDRNTGKTTSAVWFPENTTWGYHKVITAMKKAAEEASVTGVFFSDEKILGTPVTGEWTHFAATNSNVYRPLGKTAGQFAAEKKEDYNNISKAIGEFRLESLEQIVNLLKNDALFRGEKILGPAQWLLNLKKAIAGKKSSIRKNIIWSFISPAPAGFCHPRSSMIGTLLEDLSSGMPFTIAEKRFRDKMHPLKYQRITTAPKEGAIDAAEALVEKLGLERSFERRYAKLSDIQTIWQPPIIKPSSNSGIFGNLKKNHGITPVSTDSGKITAIKFASEVLPNAQKIEAYVSAYKSSGFIIFTTAVHTDAPFIFQWENPVAWYHWHGGSFPKQFGLLPGWVDVTACTHLPHMWDNAKKSTHFQKELIFILKGARETVNINSALFPEALASEMHGIRKVVEAHSKKSRLHDICGEHVVGLGIGSTVRVCSGSVITQYEIDRWD